MKEKIEAEIIEVLDTWMEAFNRLDIVAWKKRFTFRTTASLLATCESSTNRVSRMWRE